MSINTKEKICFFSFKEYEKSYYLNHFKNSLYEPVLYDFKLNKSTAGLCKNTQIVSAFVNDRLDAETLATLKEQGIRMITLRCAGTNQVDVEKAKALGIKIFRIPKYSPHSVAEHTLALCLALIRKIPQAYNRSRELNFDLKNLDGFCIYQKTVGIVGWGEIGSLVGKIFAALGAKVLAFDPYKQEEIAGIEFCDLNKILEQSHIISLNCPLTPQTKHLLNKESLQKTKKGVVILNTGRGALIHTKDLIDFLKNGHIGGVAMDVYEHEDAIFFEDHSSGIIQDDLFIRLLSFNNVLITGHQGFFTREAMEKISLETHQNICDFLAGKTNLREL